MQEFAKEGITTEQKKVGISGSHAGVSEQQVGNNVTNKKCPSDTLAEFLALIMSSITVCQHYQCD